MFAVRGQTEGDRWMEEIKTGRQQENEGGGRKRNKIHLGEEWPKVQAKARQSVDVCLCSNL